MDFFDQGSERWLAVETLLSLRLFAGRTIVTTDIAPLANDFFLKVMIV